MPSVTRNQFQIRILIIVLRRPLRPSGLGNWFDIGRVDRHSKVVWSSLKERYGGRRGVEGLTVQSTGPETVCMMCVLLVMSGTELEISPFSGLDALRESLTKVVMSASIEEAESSRAKRYVHIFQTDRSQRGACWDESPFFEIATADYRQERERYRPSMRIFVSHTLMDDRMEMTKMMMARSDVVASHFALLYPERTKVKP
jgi:hypothetical protein